jgi:hypothetical protein
MNVYDEKSFIDASRREAEKRNWRFDLREGSLSLLERLFSGEWDDSDFLSVPPGHKIIAKNDDSILGTIPGN